ncbi:hypothetical protein, partial [Listeria booriae]|uniref:hypothetical protein n=1 Tax=Listeria booriae TaxID=1552123 RepID=UPI001C8BAC97
PSLRSRLYWERNSLCSNASKKHLLEHGGKRLAMASLSGGDLENIAPFYGLTHRFAHAYIGSVTHFVRTLPTKKPSH